MPHHPDAAGAASTPLSGLHLELIARVVASCPDQWEHLARFDPATRHRVRLHSATDHDVWLETWLPGQGTGLHDHGGSAGVMIVVRGELEEHAPVLGGVVTQVRRIPEGGLRHLRRRQIHDVTNVSLAPALSVHVYSPPLAATRGYEIGGRGLRPSGRRSARSVRAS